MLFQFEDFEIDPVRFELRRSGTPIAIPRLVFDLILYLVHHRDRPVTKSELFEHVWPGRTVTEASLTQTITAARRALDDTPDTQRVIRTVHGRGYWWVAETVMVAPRGVPAPDNPIVGRETELDELSRLWDQASRGAGNLALVVGEAGIGKTRLVESLAGTVEASGAQVIWAFAHESRPTSPMSIWIQVVSAMHASGLIPRGHPAIQAIARIVRSAETGRDEDPDDLDVPGFGAARYRAIEAIVSALSCGRDMLVVLEDLHRADAGSLQTLLAVSSRLSGGRILIVGTMRPSVFAREDLARAALNTLLSQSHAALIPIRPLLKSCVDTLVRREGGDGESVELIWAESGGNPFFVWLLLRLTKSKAIELTRGRREIPNVLAAAVAARVDELASELLECLRAAAVCGQAFSVRLLSAIRGASPGDTAALLDDAVRAGLMCDRGDGEFRFNHAILRDALYEQIGTSQRARWHLAVAQALDTQAPSASLDDIHEVAHHYAESAAFGGAPRAVELLRECAETAIGRCAADDAATLLTRALDIGRRAGCLDAGLEVDMMRRLGEAHVQAGRRSAGRAALIDAALRARLRDDFESVGRAALALAPGLLSIETGALDPILVDLLESAIAALHRDSQLRIQLVGRLALALYWAGEEERIKALIAELSGAARRRTRSESGTRARLYWLASSWAPDSYLDRRQLLIGLADDVRLLPGPLRSVLRVFRVTTLLEGNEGTEARRELARFEGDVQANADAFAGWYPAMYRAMNALLDGRVADAQNLISAYREHASGLDDRNVEHCVVAQMGEALWLQGRSEDAIAGAEAVVGRFPGMPEWRCVLAFFWSLLGKREEVEARIEEMAKDNFRRLPRNMNWLLAMCALSEAAVRAGLSSRFDGIRGALLPFAERSAVAGFGVVSWGSVARFIGRVEAASANWGEAERHLRAAVMADEASGWLVPAVRSALALSEMLTEKGGDQELVEAGRLVLLAAGRIRGRGLVQLESDVARIQARVASREGAPGSIPPRRRRGVATQ